MKLRREKRTGYTVLHLEGDVLKTDDRTELSERLGLLVSEVKYLLLDIEKLKRVNSQVLGLFLVTYRTIKKKNGKMGLIRAGKHVMDLLNITSINKLISIYNSEEDFENAIRS